MYGDYDVYILPAYAVTLVLLAALTLYTVFRHRRLSKTLAQLKTDA